VPAQQEPTDLSALPEDLSAGGQPRRAEAPGQVLARGLRIELGYFVTVRVLLAEVEQAKGLTPP